LQPALKEFEANFTQLKFLVAILILHASWIRL